METSSALKVESRGKPAIAAAQADIVQGLRGHMEREEWDEAIVELMRLIRRVPDNLKLHFQLAKLYLKVGMVAKGLEQLRHCARGFHANNEYKEAFCAAEWILRLQADSQLALEIVRNVKAKLTFMREIESHPLKESLSGSLPTDALRELATHVQLRNYPEGATIVKEGELGFQFFLIRRGEARVFLTSREGEKVRLAVLHDGDFFGEISLLTGNPRTATVVAAKPSEFWVLEKPDFDRFAAKYPLVREVVHRYSGERIKKTVGRIRADGIERRVFPRVPVELEARSLLLDKVGKPLGMGALSGVIRDMSLGGVRLELPLTYPQQWPALSQLGHARVAFALEAGAHVSLSCSVVRAKLKKLDQQTYAELGLCFREVGAEDKNEINKFIRQQFLSRQTVDRQPSRSRKVRPSRERRHGGTLTAQHVVRGVPATRV